MPDASSRRARRALGGAGAVFLVAVVAAAWSAPSLVPTFRAAGQGAQRAGRVAIDIRRDRALDPRVQAARERVEPALTERFDGTRGSMQPIGWDMDAVPSRPFLDCWREGDVTGCDLTTHTGGEAAVPRT